MGSDWQIIGNYRATAVLARAVAGRPLHAYLLVGPPRVGKRTLALTFAMQLNCTGGSPGPTAPAIDYPSRRPCRTCYACRQIASGSHPDVTTIEPAEGKESITVDQVRELCSGASLRPYCGAWKVFIIPASTLTGEAADALLKTLEEPPPQVVMVLLAANAEEVPETIFSRCHVIVLGRVPASEIARSLQERDVPPAEAWRLAELARGMPGWALDALADPATVTERERMLEWSIRVSHGSLSDRLIAIEQIAGSGSRAAGIRPLVRQHLEIMLEWWRDLLLVCAGQPPLVVNRTRMDDLKREAGAHTVQSAQRSLQAIVTALARVDQNVDPRLALEALTVSL